MGLVSILRRPETAVPAAEVAEDPAHAIEAITAPHLLSPTRDTLRAYQIELRAAREAMELAMAPGRRLDAIIGEAEHLDAELATHAADLQARLGEWLAAGGTGEKPTAAPETVGLRQRRDQIEPDCAAAAAALPGVRVREQEAAVRAKAVGERLHEAIAIAAAEVGREAIPELRCFIERVLHVEGRLRGLETALRTVGNRPGASTCYHAAADAIAEAIAETKRTTAVPVDTAVGERLLAGLASDPEAKL